MSILKLKQEYNALLMRQYKAVAYLDDDNNSAADREKWIPTYKKIIEELWVIICEIESLGYKPTEDEAWGGFDMEDV